MNEPRLTVNTVPVFVLLRTRQGATEVVGVFLSRSEADAARAAVDFEGDSEIEKHGLHIGPVAKDPEPDEVSR